MMFIVSNIEAPFWLLVYGAHQPTSALACDTWCNVVVQADYTNSSRWLEATSRSPSRRESVATLEFTTGHRAAGLCTVSLGQQRPRSELPQKLMVVAVTGATTPRFMAAFARRVWWWSWSFGGHNIIASQRSFNMKLRLTSTRNWMIWRAGLFVELVNEDKRRDEQRSFSKLKRFWQVKLWVWEVVLSADVDVDSLAVIRDLDVCKGGRVKMWPDVSCTLLASFVSCPWNSGAMISSWKLLLHLRSGARFLCSETVSTCWVFEGFQWKNMEKMRNILENTKSIYWEKHVYLRE